MRRKSSTLALVVALTAASLTMAAGRAVADTDTTLNLNCVAHAPLIGDQPANQTLTVSTAGPDHVLPGTTFSLTTTFPVSQIAANQGAGTVSSVKNLWYKVPVPANSTFVSASVSGGFNFGPPVSVGLVGSPTTGYLEYNVPGPIPAGQDFQLPALTVTLTAGTTHFATIQPRLGGTSIADPGFKTTAVITSPISADVPTDCYPAPPNPPFHTTTIVPPDTFGPTITINTPANGAQYPLGQEIPADYACDDGPFGSGVATCDGTVADGANIDTSTLGTKTFTVTSSDNEGNDATPVTHTYEVVPGGNDFTPPQVTITSPANGSTVTQGAALTASYACVDNESGLASCAGDVANGAAISTATTGAKSFTVTALDNEGNPHTVRSSYRVMPPGVQQNWTSGDVTNRMPVACDTLFQAFHESIPVTSNVIPTSAGAGSQFNWDFAIGDDYIPSFNNGSNLIYRWKAPTNAHFVSVAFTGAGNMVNGSAISILPDGKLQLTVASVTDQSFLGFGDDHFNPPPFRAVIQADGPTGSVIQNMFDYFQLNTTLGGTSHCPAGDPTHNGRVNPILSNTTVIDSAPPSITISSPVHGAIYAPGSTVPFTYSCTDNVGTPSCVGTLTSGSPIDTSTSGVYQLSVTSTDGAGNTSQRWVTYSVARPTVSVADVTVVEGPGATLDFVVSLSNPSSRTITVEYDTADGTAVDPTDYSGVAGSLEFLPGGATSQTVQVPVADDNELRPDRSMSFTLSDAINALIDDGDATGTIVDDDPPELSLSNAFAIEGPGAALTFTVTLDQDPNFPVAVEYATQDGTAVAPDRYQAATGTLTFNPGEALSQQVVIPVVNDSIYNAGASSNNVQTMTLTAGIPSRGISLTGTGSIIDDETRPPVLSIGSLELREGDERNRPVKLWVSLNAPATQLITVQYTTMAGSATVGDFKAKTGTLTFKPGIIMKSVPLVLTGDTAVEGDEAFTVQLSSPVNAIVNDGVGEVSILDDDSPSAATVEATISDAKVYEGGGVRKRVSISFTVSLSKRPTAPVSISYSTSSGVGPDGAISTIDFLNKVGTLNFTPMQVAKVVTVSVFADSALEVDETFSVNLLSATGPVTITDATGTGTILNDD